MQKLILPVLLAGVIVIYLLLLPNVWSSRQQARASIPAGYMIPSKYNRVLAVGNKGVLSDFLFLKVITFVGGRGTSETPMTEDDWSYVVNSLEVITDLDPYFVDPYMLAEGLLAWDAHKPEEANRVLEKGIKHRFYDWRLPYFVGFNHFYFLKDYDVAADFIMAASKLQGSPGYLKTLAARLAYYGGKSKTALLFLREMLIQAEDPLLRRKLERRLRALEGAVVLEDAIDKFKEQQGRLPRRLDELVSFGYLFFFPVEPYGGEWVMNNRGRVYSTSKFTDSLDK